MTQIRLLNSTSGKQEAELIFSKLVEAERIFYHRLGILNIAEKCESLRMKYLDSWLVGAGPELPQGVGWKQAICEATPLFELDEPEQIDVYLAEKFSGDSDHCMDIRQTDSPSCFHLNVYLDRFVLIEDEYTWVSRAGSPMGYRRWVTMNGGYHYSILQHSVRTVAFHEFLHASGDAPWFRRIDGIIRHEYIGLNAVLDLL